MARASEASEARVPFPWATIIPTSALSNAGVFQRYSNRSRQAIAIQPNLNNARSFRDAARAEKLAEDVGSAFRCVLFFFQYYSCRSFAKNCSMAILGRTA
jgi:hypothetical protein